MTVSKGRSALVGTLVLVATALFAQGAQASITPSLSLDQSAGTQAGAAQNLSMDLKLNNAGSYPVADTPEHLTINLPPGLLSNADVNGGACLKTADLSDTNCQVGTGTVTAYAGLPNDGLVQMPTAVTFDLVPPPAPGDLAGLAVNSNGNQIGSTAGIVVRPSGDPDGVGVTIHLLLPNQLDASALGLPLGSAGAPIEITEINSTFDGLRYPTTCPSTPANVSVSVDSYNDPAVHNLSAPLNVTGCSTLPYAPKLSVSAVKDSSDRSVKITAGVTQAADESPTKSLSLAFPDAALGVNLAAIKLLCLDVSKGCTPVGTATAVSPLYPTPLTANAYLTGKALGPTLTLVFPPPFPLTLVGTVTLTTKKAVFTGLPDIPLTSLSMVFNGGAESMFLTNCNPGDGVAAGSSTDQNGDKTVSTSIKYHIVGCPASSYNTGSGKSGANSSSAPTVTTSGLRGVKSGHPSLSLRVVVRKHQAALTQLSVQLTPGISFVRHRVGKHLKITGVAVTGARVKALAISHGRLVIRLRRPASAFRVKLTSVLHEDNALIASASRGKRVRLHLTLVALNTRHRSHTIHKLIGL
ncbi:MAG: hypothetical protein KGL15_06230 [Acidobacteriota bacterium]|nr:hypothetical protein [Acidobacteriota bacterium]